MTDFNNLTPTGRKTSGPTADLIELAVPDGNFQTAIVYKDAYHAHTGLTTDVELVQSFMEFPMVDGLSDMTRAVIGKGIFQFDTGSVMVLYDILRAMRDKRKPLGIRAGVELCIHIGNALQEASENGPMQGIYSSNGLTPWRIVIDAEGMPSIIGYGLPQIDMVAFRENGEGKPREESFKCCPPERLLSGDEDISSDIYSLALIAVEVMTGKPLLNGSAKELYKLVTHGEAQQLLLSNPGKIPSDVHNILVQALAYDPMGRFEEPRDFADGLADALEQTKMTGDSLATIIKKVAPTLQKGKVLQSASDASDRKPIPIRMAPGGGRRAKPPAREASPTAHTPDAGDRWGKVARSGASESEESPSRRRTRKSTDEQEDTSSRRTRSARNRTDSTGTRRSRRGRTTPEEEEDSASETPTRSRRSRGDTATPRRSRRGRAAATAEETDAITTAPEAAEATTANVVDTKEAEAVSAEAPAKEEDAPKRPRRAKRAAKKETQETAKTEEAEAVSAEAPAKEEDAPKRPRRAKRAAKKETPEAAKAEEAESVSAEEAVSAEAPAKEEDAPKRPRRAKRTAKKETPEAAKTEEAEAVSAEAPAKEEDAPKRPRRAKRAAKKETPEAAKAEEAESVSAEEAVSAEAPAKEEDAPKRPRRAKRTAKKETPEAAKTEEAEAVSAEAPAKEEDAPKRPRRASRASNTEDSPRRSRRSRGTSESSEEAPRRMRRSRGAVSDEEEAPKRSRRSARSNDDGDGEAPARPRRSRRTRKTEE